VVFKLVGVITPTMAVKRHRRGDRVYLSEYKQVREGKRIKSVFIRYLGPEDRVKAGKKPGRRVLDALDIKRSYRAGDVRLLWNIAKDLGFIETIDGICCQKSRIEGPSPGKFLTVWAINRVIDPESCTQLERWVTTTDLPSITGIDRELFTKDAFLSSLDFVCSHDSSSSSVIDHAASIDDTLYQRWRQHHPLSPGDKETVAYDLTSVLFYGVTCPLAELGYNTRKAKRRQVNLALLVSKLDKHPIAHFVYNGSRNASSTVKNLLSKLKDTPLEAGTIIWDRGNVSKDHVKSVESAGWKLICAVPKISNEVCAIIEETDVALNPSTFIHKTRSGHIYAVKTEGHLFGRDRSVIVYVNQEQRASMINARNEALAEIGKELSALSEKNKWSEAKLHRKIKTIVGSWSDYIQVTVKRKGNSCIEWKYKSRQITKSERSYGKYLLLSTDESLSTVEIVKTYFEKDFVEKVFRTLKTTEDLEPVRHRLEHRVRAYMFICVLAYRLLSALRFRLAEARGEDKSCEHTSDLLRDLGRVERVDVGFGKEVKTWYLNVTKSTKEILKKIRMKDLLKEEIRLKT
jgi:transposase